MRNINKTAEQRGTLLMEAIAMLGLIAMVTPTLYKKSAERMQEIQDINIAGQARNMDHIINTFVINNLSELKKDSTGIERGKTLKLSYEDTNDAGYFYKGYSSYVPAGYNPKDLKTYNEPEIYVHRYNTDNSATSVADAFVYFIVYPNKTNSDEKRAARVASLVGSNGGTVMIKNNKPQVYGTGGGWGLDSTLIGPANGTNGKVGIPENVLTKNSLVITSPEPLTTDMIDSDVFLYRVRADEPYRNAMSVSLYMGGVEDTEGQGENYLNSIYNVHRLLLNTKCQRGNVEDAAGGGSSLTDIDSDCPANVADLYIGKPLGTDTKDQNIAQATGAAWIYGNLSAINENFRLYNGDNPSSISYGSNVQDGQNAVLEFVRKDPNTYAEAITTVLRAENKEGSARVSLMNDFAQVEENGGIGQRKFLVGNSTNADAFIGVHEGSSEVYINSPKEGADDSNRTTLINTAGGVVRIGGRGSDSSISEVYLNTEGGGLYAGSGGSWIHATGDDSSYSEVHILKSVGENDLFTVGGSSAATNYKIRADSTIVGLRGGRVQVVEKGDAITNLSTNAGGLTHLLDVGVNTSVFGQGQTAILTKYTDITGYTYLGANMLQNFDSVWTASDSTGAEHFYRHQWNLAVAGSAYVDSTLAANEAWFKRSGFKNLHAGFSSYADWKSNPTKAMLNVYDDHLVIRNRSNMTGDDEPGNFGASSASGSLMYVDSSQIRLQTPRGAAFELMGNMARFGAGVGSSEISADDSSGIRIEVKDDSSHTVNIQDSAMVFTKKPGSMNDTPTNMIEAHAGEFRVRTLGNNPAYGAGSHNGAQLYVDSSETGVRNVDFKVSREDPNNSTAAFYVAPKNYDTSSHLGTTDGAGNATVNVDGTLHVKGNRVIHIASDATNAASSTTRAMFEIDPDYIQVMDKDSSGAIDGNFAMFKVNARDITGAATSSLASTPAANTGVYVRRGAIELEKSSGSSWAADAGYGYILANRMVSNEGKTIPALPNTMTNGYPEGIAYDQFMVNPAYTSVMHDIKLTTRGGARLSDILPDYVLKGVYNLSNNCEEGETSKVSCQNDNMNKWADPYVGIIPYASCPPGYLNMTTLVPISFNVGRAGSLIQESRDETPKWVVSGAQHQAAVLRHAGFDGDNIIEPDITEATTYVYNGVYSSAAQGTFPFSSYTASRPEGWFLGFKAPINNAGTGTDAQMEAYNMGSAQVWQYKDSSTSGWKAVIEPLYFQQNTWLKTTVNPIETKGWKAYMGFIYDITNEWVGLGSYGLSAPVNNVFQKGGSSATNLTAGNFKWNLFPVPTNTIEGHAMVYCYFDRKQFNGWTDTSGQKLVDQIDQLGALKKNDGISGYNDAPAFRAPGEKSDTDFNQRLRDPSLKYSDPW